MRTIEVMREVGEGAWYVYSALLALADDNGDVKTTLDELCEQTGLGVRTLQRRIGVLAKLALVERKKTFEGVLYNVHKASELTSRQICRDPIINTSLKDLKDLKDGETTIRAKTKRPNATEALFQHWLASYKDRYGVDYRVSNFAREKGALRTLLAKYDNDVERLKATVGVVMRLYDSRWKSQQYTRPTIGAFCSWLAAQAEAYVPTVTDAPSIKDAQDIDLGAYDARFGL